VAYRVVTPETMPLVSGRGRKVVEAVPTMVLRNDFGSLDDWFSSLTRSRRSSVRGQVKKISADPGIVVRTATARDDLDGGELAGLLLAHRARMGTVKFDSRGPVTAEYLEALVRRPDVVTTTYHDESGRLLAFSNLLDHPVVPLYQHWAARTFDEGRPKHLYFDVIVRTVRYMIEGNRKSLSMGRGLGEVKSSLGFTPRPLRAVVVPRPVAG
jgi:hypothetical protein